MTYTYILAEVFIHMNYHNLCARKVTTAATHATMGQPQSFTFLNTMANLPQSRLITGQVPVNSPIAKFPQFPNLPMEHTMIILLRRVAALEWCSMVPSKASHMLIGNAPYTIVLGLIIYFRHYFIYYAIRCCLPRYFTSFGHTSLSLKYDDIYYFEYHSRLRHATISINTTILSIRLKV